MRTSTLNRLAAATAVVLTCASAAPVLGQTPPQQGVNLTLWNSTVDLSDLATSLDRAKSDGVNSVNVNTFWFQSDINATTIGPGGWTNGGLVTATDQTVADVIAAIHQRGMSAVLKPIVVPANSNETGNWQGQIVGGDTWFNNPNGFRAMMNHNADLARQNNADGLVVGTELVATTSQ